MKKNPHYAVGLAIKHYRENSGLSQRKLAKAVNISNAMLSMLEAGKRESINATTLHDIHLVLGVTCDEIMEKAREKGNGNGHTVLLKSVYHDNIYSNEYRSINT